MTVLFRHSAQLELSRFDYTGAVAMQELHALAAFLSSEPAWLCVDSLSVIADGAVFVDADEDSLEAVYQTYKAAFAKLNFIVLRRSGWICDSPRAQPLLQFWLGGHDAANDTASDARQFCSFSAAGDWLMLSPTESKLLESGEGFREIARFEADLTRARAG